MGRIHENHARRILATFTHIDQLLESVENLARPNPSPFSRERPDMSEKERKQLVSFVKRARERMLAAFDRLGIPRPEPGLSARRSVATSLLYAEIALAELDVATLRGYGPLDERTAAEIRELAEALSRVMQEGAALIRDR